MIRRMTMVAPSYPRGPIPSMVFSQPPVAGTAHGGGGARGVRGQLGMALDDLDFDEPWLVVDVMVNERGLAKLPATSVQCCEPDRPCTLVIGPARVGCFWSVTRPACSGLFWTSSSFRQ